MIQFENLYKMTLGTAQSEAQSDYWKAILAKIRAKRMEHRIIKFYEEYKEVHP